MINLPISNLTKKLKKLAIASFTMGFFLQVGMASYVWQKIGGSAYSLTQLNDIWTLVVIVFYSLAILLFSFSFSKARIYFYSKDKYAKISIILIFFVLALAVGALISMGTALVSLILGAFFPTYITFIILLVVFISLYKQYFRNHK